jgi:hypothetical protein
MLGFVNVSFEFLQHRRSAPSHFSKMASVVQPPVSAKHSLFIEFIAFACRIASNYYAPGSLYLGILKIPLLVSLPT